MRILFIMSAILMLLISPTLLMAQPFSVEQAAVECNGRCDLISLGEACAEGSTPIAVDCQNVQNQNNSQFPFPCGIGNGQCAFFPAVLSSDPINDYCEDTGGWDANVYCAQGFGSFPVERVAVECNGRCDLIRLNQVCAEGSTPIVVDCQNVMEQRSSPVDACGGGNGRCVGFPLDPFDLIGNFCDDIGGWDANVYCARGGSLFFSVERAAVECNGRCDLISLGEACAEGSTPIAVDCQNVMEQGCRVAACGGGNGLCAGGRVLSRDHISDYCDDIGGWDANVYCAR